MYKYKNKKTGAIFETICRISGENWEEVTTKKSPKKSDKKAETEVEESKDE